MTDFRRVKRWVSATLLLGLALLGFAMKAGRWLVVDRPRRSEVIVVLAGETDQRPARALELLAQGYGSRVLLDVPAAAKVYEFSAVELARKYARDLPQAAIDVCPIVGLSTKDEARDVEKCLTDSHTESILIVTSDFHTRRALSIFRRELPGKVFSVAASYDDGQFGTRWWTHCEWAKTTVDEWLKLIWWVGVDRWR